jgi:hypothetical protein
MCNATGLQAAYTTCYGHHRTAAAHAMTVSLAYLLLEQSMCCTLTSLSAAVAFPVLQHGLVWWQDP